MATYNDTGINSEQSLESRYNNKAQERELYLERARDCSELTIPTLIPQDGYYMQKNLRLPIKVSELVA